MSEKQHEEKHLKKPSTLNGGGDDPPPPNSDGGGGKSGLSGSPLAKITQEVGSQATMRFSLEMPYKPDFQVQITIREV